MREICLDTETTGLEPRDGHKIVEIGCVEMINGVRTGKTYHIYINPQRDMPEAAFRIHGISNDFLQDKPLFKDIAQDFIDFIKDSKLIIHNAAFDMKFINFELRQCDMEIIERGVVIDSLQMARNKFPGSPNSLDALCKRFNIDSSKRTKHGALLDSELLADVYLELCGGSQYSMFKDEDDNIENSATRDIKGQNQSQNNSQNLNMKKAEVQYRNFKLTKEEESSHEEFMKNNFKKNFWYSN